MVSAQLAAGDGSAPSFGTTGRRGGRRLRKHCRQRVMKSHMSSASMPAGSDIFRLEINTNNKEAAGGGGIPNPVAGPGGGTGGDGSGDQSVTKGKTRSEPQVIVPRAALSTSGSPISDPRPPLFLFKRSSLSHRAPLPPSHQWGEWGVGRGKREAGRGCMGWPRAGVGKGRDCWMDGWMDNWLAERIEVGC